MCRKNYEVIMTIDLHEFDNYSVLQDKLEGIGLFSGVSESRYTGSEENEIEFINSEESKIKFINNIDLTDTTFAGCFTDSLDMINFYSSKCKEIKKILDNEEHKGYEAFIFIFDRISKKFRKFFIEN